MGTQRQRRHIQVNLPDTTPEKIHRRHARHLCERPGDAIVRHIPNPVCGKRRIDHENQKRRALMSNFLTTGSSASSGSVAVMLLTRVEMSRVAWVMSVS